MKILNLKTYGMKNIKSEINISFSNTTISSEIKFDSKIKAIFGSNGAGKSALISSVQLYKDIVYSGQYLLNISNQSNLKNLINFETKTFFFEIVFLENIEGLGENIYRHSIELIFDENIQQYIINKERLEMQKGRSLNDFITLMHYENYKLYIDSEYKDKTANNFFAEFGRTYGTQSFVTYIFLKTINSSGKEFLVNLKERKYNYPAFITWVNTVSLSIYLLDSDKHDRFLKEAQIANVFKKLSSDTKDVSLDYLKSTFKIDKYEDKVDKSSYHLYENEVKLLENFIKVFKPNLKHIRIDKIIDGNVYKCRKIFEYDNYEVDIEYESSGIKHLVTLHSYLLGFYRGNIVFIDELDTNISSVYLKTLMQFLLENAKGQLILTTHNLDLMEVLKREKTSINAIGFDNVLDTWVINGNRNPKNYYVDGYFEHTPNNVESFDFRESFEIGK